MFKYNWWVCLIVFMYMYGTTQRGQSLVCHNNPVGKKISYWKRFHCSKSDANCGTITRDFSRIVYRIETPQRSYFCCEGWTGGVAKNCPIPICTNGCNGGGECVSPETCHCFKGFSPPMCRDCQSGLFGDKCGFQCHCKKSTHCGRDGSCSHGCDPAWTGSNCSIALPYLGKQPRVVKRTATTLTLNITWLASKDLGSGPIVARKVYFKDMLHSSFTEVDLTDEDTYTICNLMLNMSVTYYARHARKVNGIIIYGPSSPHGSANTTCSEPLDTPSLNLLSRTETNAVIKVQEVNNNPSRIQCDRILYYQVRCRLSNEITNDTNTNSNSNATIIVDNSGYNVHSTTNVNGSSRVVIPGLEKCFEYLVDARVVNSAKYASAWSQPVLIWPVKEAPSDIPSPTIISRKESKVVVELQEVNDDPGRILCVKILYYQVRCRSPSKITNDTNNNTRNTTHGYTGYSIHSMTNVKGSRVVIPGLEKCSEYLVDARVVNNANYSSAWSQPVTIWPVKEASYVPENISVMASSYISARWSSPDDEQCFDILYHIVLKFGNTTISVTTNATQVDFLQVTVQPNMEYIFQVAMILGDMVGNYSDEIIVMVEAYANDVNGERSNEWLAYMGLLIAFILCVTLILVIFKYKKSQAKPFVIDTGVRNVKRRSEVQHFAFHNSIMGPRQRVYTEMNNSNTTSSVTPKCAAAMDSADEDVVELAKMNMIIKDGGNQKQLPCEQHIYEVIERRCKDKTIASSERAATYEASSDEFEGVAELKKDDGDYIGLLPTEENVYAELKKLD
ncbi:uncharacterized protein LOC117100556 [Anneissia japonica]|uniref:uncharacterized protein LOC117100556 n=1 Tax=Anneissia japonica TaxID=1529436 RepID=UPI0014259BED|nr:uncharacterized protein LOC117100556 [Anneissia japonica]